MRVAIFSDTYLPEINGVARTLGRWTAYLEKQGIDYMVFAPGHNQSVASSAESAVKRSCSIPFLLYPECRFALPNPLDIKNALSAFRPTLIHVATPFMLGLFGQHYAKKHDIPLIASYHTNFDQYLPWYKVEWLSPVFWKYMHWFHADCRQIFVPSQSTKAYLMEKGFSRLEIWSRGVDTEKFCPDWRLLREETLLQHGADPEKFTLLYVGRLAPEKSTEVLFDAWNQLSDALRDRSQLIIAGNGPQYESLVKRAQGQAIHCIGFVEGKELSRLYAAADLFVFPSATETFGNVVLEAMAAGTAVVGVAAGGVKDNIDDGVTGLLCSPGNAATFAAAITTLYHDEALRSQLAQGGLDYARQKSWNAVFDGLLEHCRSAQYTHSAADSPRSRSKRSLLSKNH